MIPACKFLLIVDSIGIHRAKLQGQSIRFAILNGLTGLALLLRDMTEVMMLDQTRADRFPTSSRTKLDLAICKRWGLLVEFR